jgi:hypothetical protein
MEAFLPAIYSLLVGATVVSLAGLGLFSTG